MSAGSTPLRVLLSNDDGPPGKDSPNVFGLYMVLTRSLGWDVKVVIPSSQKSWIGKAYQIKDMIKGVYYYPKGPDGRGETSNFSRPLREGEVGEWILLDGTPATCTNIALHNLYPGQIDLVVSGPNHGHNTSAAFSLSSGTLGAALSACLSKKRAIALSYGHFPDGSLPGLGDDASSLAAKIIQKLWGDWGKDEEGIRDGEVDFYSVNIPLVNQLRQPGGLDVIWTRVYRNNYGQLFKRKEEGDRSKTVPAAGPGAPPEPPTSIRTLPPDSESPETSNGLVFQFAPADIEALVFPPLENLPHGSDGWAMHYRKASVTPFRASFAEPSLESLCLATERGTEGLGPGREFQL